jgi:PAS domain S-box-containing protein
MALVIVETSFLSSSQTLEAILLELILFVSMLVITIYYLPFYRMYMNHVRAAFLSIVIATQIAQLTAHIRFRSETGHFERGVLYGDLPTTMFFFIVIPLVFMSVGFCNLREEYCALSIPISKVPSAYVLELKIRSYLRKFDYLFPRVSKDVKRIDDILKTKEIEKKISFEDDDESFSDFDLWEETNDTMPTREDVVKTIEDWMIECADKFDGDVFFHYLWALTCINLSTNVHFSAIQIHRAESILQKRNIFFRIATLDLGYLLYETRIVLESFYDPVDLEVIRYVKLQNLRAEVYEEQKEMCKDLSNLHTFLESEHKRGVEGAMHTGSQYVSEEFLTKMHLMANEIFEKISFTYKVFNEIMRLSNRSSQSCKAYSLFLSSMTSEEKKAVELMFRARDTEVQGDQAEMKTGESSGLSTHRDFDLVPGEILSEEFTQSSVIIIISAEVGSEGTILDIHGAYTKRLGYQREDLVGSNIRKLVPHPYDSNHDSYIKDYVKYGVGTLIDTTRLIVMHDKEGFIVPTLMTLKQLLTQKDPLTANDKVKKSQAKDQNNSNNHSSLQFCGVLRFIRNHSFRGALLIRANGLITGVSKNCKKIWGLTPQTIAVQSVYITSIMPQLTPHLEKCFQSKEESVEIRKKIDLNIKVGATVYTMRVKLHFLNERIFTIIVEYHADVLNSKSGQDQLSYLSSESIKSVPHSNEDVGDLRAEVDVKRASYLNSKVAAWIAHSVEFHHEPETFKDGELVVREEAPQSSVVPESSLKDEFGTFETYAQSGKVLTNMRKTNSSLRQVYKGGLDAQSTDIISMEAGGQDRRQAYLTSIVQLQAADNQSANQVELNSMSGSEDQPSEVSGDVSGTISTGRSSSSRLIGLTMRSQRKVDLYLFLQVKRQLKLLFFSILFAAVIIQINFADFLQRLQQDISLSRYVGGRRSKMWESLNVMHIAEFGFRFGYVSTFNSTEALLHRAEKDIERAFNYSTTVLLDQELYSAIIQGGNFSAPITQRIGGALVTTEYPKEDAINYLILKLGRTLKFMQTYSYLNETLMYFDLLQDIQNIPTTVFHALNEAATISAGVLRRRILKVQSNLVLITIIPPVLALFVCTVYIYPRLVSLELRVCEILVIFLRIPLKSLRKMRLGTVAYLEELDSQMTDNGNVEKNNYLKQRKTKSKGKQEHRKRVKENFKPKSSGGWGVGRKLRSLLGIRGTRKKLYKHLKSHIVFICFVTLVFFGLNLFFSLDVASDVER